MTNEELINNVEEKPADHGTYPYGTNSGNDLKKVFTLVASLSFVSGFVYELGKDVFKDVKTHFSKEKKLERKANRQTKKEAKAAKKHKSCDVIIDDDSVNVNTDI